MTDREKYEKAFPIPDWVFWEDDYERYGGIDSPKYNLLLEGFECGLASRTAEIKKLEEWQKTAEKYLEFLKENDMTAFASYHGILTPPELIIKGKEFRDRLALLKGEDI